MGEAASATGPDFAQGIPLDEVAAAGTVAGRVDDEPVLLSLIDGELFALSGTCTHYGAALAGGLIDGDCVRCPLHHARFNLRSGKVIRGPALDPLDRWRVETQGGTVFVREKIEAPAPPAVMDAAVERVVIVGGGAAGLSCANELRRIGFAGSITMLSAEADPPCDRPNLSKDYLAGTAPEEWIPLRPDDWYRDQNIDLRLSTRVAAIDVHGRSVVTVAGEHVAYDRLLLATGSEPNRLAAPGFDRPNVLTLRSLADARAIAELATPGSRAAIVGSSFIGLEAAAALRKRGASVDVVSIERVPFERVLGSDIGRFLQSLHEENGVRFHFGRGVATYDGRLMRLADGAEFEADFVLVGIGVRPRVELAEHAGIATGDGVLVDQRLETCIPGIFAAGDIASYPDPLTGERARVEHWVMAVHQGQTAAANMLGVDKTLDAVPFFWTEQYGRSLRYVGNATGWDRIEFDGEVGSDAFAVRFFAGPAHRATASLGMDADNLRDEQALEQKFGNSAPRPEPVPGSGIEWAL